MTAAIAPLPPKDADIDELAEYFAAHLAELQLFDGWMFAVKRRLAEAVRDLGPLQTSAGKLMIESSGYEYPPEVADVFPTLGKHYVTFELETLEQSERAISLVTEELPRAVPSHEMRVDGRAAASLINQGGAAAHQLLDLRRPKGAKLALKVSG